MTYREKERTTNSFRTAYTYRFALSVSASKAAKRAREPGEAVSGEGLVANWTLFRLWLLDLALFPNPAGRCIFLSLAIAATIRKLQLQNFVAVECKFTAASTDWRLQTCTLMLLFAVVATVQEVFKYKHKDSSLTYIHASYT